jgi:hypothetical protein
LLLRGTEVSIFDTDNHFQLCYPLFLRNDFDINQYPLTYRRSDDTKILEDINTAFKLIWVLFLRTYFKLNLNSTNTPAVLLIPRNPVLALDNVPCQTGHETQSLEHVQLR